MADDKKTNKPQAKESVPAPSWRVVIEQAIAQEIARLTESAKPKEPQDEE